MGKSYSNNRLDTFGLRSLEKEEYLVWDYCTRSPEHFWRNYDASCRSLIEN
jgi:hypothetical protein